MGTQRRGESGVIFEYGSRVASIVREILAGGVSVHKPRPLPERASPAQFRDAAAGQGPLLRLLVQLQLALD